MQRTARGSAAAADTSLLVRIRKILRAAQSSAVRTVNTAHVISSWLIGREIVEDEQRGSARASYQDRTLQQLAERLTKTFGAGYSAENLKRFRQFCLVFPDYLDRDQIGYALRTQFGRGSTAQPASELDRNQRFVELVGGAVDDALEESGWAHLGAVGSILNKKEPDFDSRNYGYSKLSDLLEASNHFELRRQDKVVSVRRVQSP
jgi:hypothetical protein